MSAAAADPAVRADSDMKSAKGAYQLKAADAERKDELLARADLALYAAKSEGGDRIVTHLAGPSQDSRPAPEDTIVPVRVQVNEGFLNRFRFFAGRLRCAPFPDPVLTGRPARPHAIIPPRRFSA